MHNLLVNDTALALVFCIFILIRSAKLDLSTGVYSPKICSYEHWGSNFDCGILNYIKKWKSSSYD